MSEIRIEHARKVYNGKTVVIDDLNLTIENGELFTLLGPSGCGKTTLLRMIAGFNSIEGGDFFFGETRINDMEPSKRNIGMVFQNYAIFPHLTVRDNVAFGLKQRKVAKEELETRTDEYLKLMQIDQFADRKPDQLSGGQQQRVALARALVINPDVLLMDEPLSNLDAKLRVDMRQAIRDIQRSIGITTVYVTHDQEEAMTISDHIAVMNLGEIQQVGSPKELYHKPHNEFVANFIGKTNLIDAKIIKENNKTFLQIGEYKLELQEYDHVEPQDVRVSIRPEEFIKDESGVIEATVDNSVYLGSSVNYLLNTNFAERIEVTEESTFEENLKPGDVIHLAVNTSKINIFTADGTQNLLEQVK
ncbi:ABC transporter ATP-binding protein [Lancefieldella parvula]|jgi:ABC transporter family protein|uniref:ABC transporter ATP-binding protein n=1 Tax=Lancefieldella parvula TaxID=1382 RepID=UPI0028D157FF|nr:ABC transporter ATP-binding protein [Lancefieldella parvula]